MKSIILGQQAAQEIREKKTGAETFSICVIDNILQNS
jgi:hypothetical protein